MMFGNKIVISHGKTKRSIRGDFAICSDYDTLRDIANQILDEIGDRDASGWVKISFSKDPYLVGVEPVEWDD